MKCFVNVATTTGGEGATRGPPAPAPPMRKVTVAGAPPAPGAEVEAAGCPSAPERNGRISARPGGNHKDRVVSLRLLVGGVSG